MPVKRDTVITEMVSLTVLSSVLIYDTNGSYAHGDVHNNRHSRPPRQYIEAIPYLALRNETQPYDYLGRWAQPMKYVCPVSKWPKTLKQLPMKHAGECGYVNMKVSIAREIQDFVLL